VIAIPQQAINYSLYGNSIFVIMPGTDKQGHPDQVAHAVAVELGAQEGNLVQVTSGLTAGDNIVTDGLVKLQNGNAVKIITQTTQSHS
jgi:membrane fusion protein (multidrug efflux system)